MPRYWIAPDSNLEWVCPSTASELGTFYFRGFSFVLMMMAAIGPGSKENFCCHLIKRRSAAFPSELYLESSREVPYALVLRTKAYGNASGVHGQIVCHEFRTSICRHSLSLSRREPRN